jgi:hypothetical protein
MRELSSPYSVWRWWIQGSKMRLDSPVSDTSSTPCHITSPSLPWVIYLECFWNDKVRTEKDKIDDPRSRNTKPQLVLLTNQTLTFLVVREPHWDTVSFQGGITTPVPSLLAWSPIASWSIKSGSEDYLPVRNHLPTLLTGRSPSPPLAWFSGDAKVHACSKVKKWKCQVAHVVSYPKSYYLPSTRNTQLPPWAIFFSIY